MTCINKILELKGDQEIFKVERIVIEGGGEYKGYEFLVTFTDMGFRCGYVAVPPTHPVHSFFNEDYNYPELECHGGVTFFGKSHLAELLIENPCEDKWVGFDCGHCEDLTDLKTFDKYFPEADKFQRDYVDGNSSKKSTIWPMEMRTKDYVIENCKRMIDELITKEAA